MGNILTTEDASADQLRRAVDYHLRAKELVDPANKYELSTIYYNLGVGYAYLKDYAEAYKALEKCLAIGREINDPHTIAFVNYRMGSIDLAQGNHGEALARFDELPLVVRVPSLPALAPGTRVELAVSDLDLLELTLRCDYRRQTSGG